MSDEFAFIRAIRENRDDDVPRLVYADWLEENGQPERAEFIRVQCWLSANPMSDPAWDANWEREQELLRDNRECWTGPYRWMREDLFLYCDRGFPSLLYFHDPNDFIPAADYLFERLATDRVMLGWTTDDEARLLSRSRELSGVRELWLCEEGRGLSYAGVGAVVTSEHTQQIERLAIDRNPWRDVSVLRLLAEQDCLPHLRHLHMMLDYHGDGGNNLILVTQLLESPHRHGLRGLEVWHLSDADVVRLARHPALARLTHLDFGHTGVTSEGAEALLNSPYLDQIQLLAYAGAGDEVPLSQPMIDRLREQFGNRIVLDPNVNIGGPQQHAYQWRAVTGRAK